jgi:TRAP-type C4-dicarboxylate transport system substrate-binding protein
VTQLPFVVEASSVDISTALWRLYESGVIAEEYTRVKPLSLSVFVASGFLGSKPVRGLDDLKGMKVSVGAKIHGQIAEIAGGAPITMPATELYQSLQRGLVDAAVMGWAAVPAYKLYEVARYFVDSPLGNSGKFVVMNKDSYAKLPESSRATLDRLSGVNLSRRMAAGTAEESAHGRETVKAMSGYTVTVSGEDEFAKWRPRMQPLIDEWVKTTPDGEKVLAAYKVEVSKARAETR